MPHDADDHPEDDLNRTTCPKCGARLFHAIPGQTTEAEILAFAREAGWEHVIQERWIHPGIYCPKGCYGVLVHYAPPPPTEETRANFLPARLFLESPGPNRKRVILWMHQACGISLAEAKRRVDEGNRLIAEGLRWELRELQRGLQALGATAHIVAGQ